MAKVTMIFTDEDDGTVKISTDFEPELQMDQPTTNAQETALNLLQDVRSGENFMDSLARHVAEGRE